MPLPEASKPICAKPCQLGVCTLGAPVPVQSRCLVRENILPFGSKERKFGDQRGGSPRFQAKGRRLMARGSMRASSQTSANGNDHPLTGIRAVHCGEDAKPRFRQFGHASLASRNPARSKTSPGRKPQWKTYPPGPGLSLSSASRVGNPLALL